MSDLTIIVNKREYDVPDTVTTLPEFLEAVGYTGREFEVYRIDGDSEQQLNGPMFVFDEGDEFVVVPKYITGG